MPRQGDGTSDNNPIEYKQIIHGTGTEKVMFLAQEEVLTRQ
jgi:hypothetical protein